jgi:hypothetical protein
MRDRDRQVGRTAAQARPSARLTGHRATELSLAALVSGAALFSTFVTDAAPQSDLASGLPSPSIDLSQFARSEVSTGSRAAVAAALGGQGAALRLAAAPDIQDEAGQSRAGSIALTPDVSVRARARAPEANGWTGSALGVQMTASTRQLADLPPVFLVGGAGRESYVIAPGSALSYTLAPAGVEASVGDAHFGVGVELARDAFVTAGYVREQRRYRNGMREWKEEEHYAGIALRARW